MRNLSPTDLDNLTRRETEAGAHGPVQETAEAEPDWEAIGRDIAARYPNTLAKLAE
jgi:hypothetical protein